MDESRAITADRGDAGRRLDHVLMRRLHGLSGASRTRVQLWIRSGRVEMNGRPTTRVATRTTNGDVITVLVPGEAVRLDERPWLDATTPTPTPALNVLFEDDDLLAIDKPAGIVVHPTYRHTTGTLMHALMADAFRWPTDARRPSIVGRLDKHTSGVVLVAKTRAMHAALQRTLAHSSSEKSYLAIVYGPVKAASGTIDLPLIRDPRDRRRVVVSGRGAPSVTVFERLAMQPDRRQKIALMRCRLKTGRMHQIRVHLAARGWPIVGDAVYGEPRWPRVADPELSQLLRGCSRQALHAWRLAFTHPATGGRVAVEAPVPRDMRTLIDYCGWTITA